MSIRSKRFNQSEHFKTYLERRQPYSQISATPAVDVFHQRQPTCPQKIGVPEPFPRCDGLHFDYTLQRPPDNLSSQLLAKEKGKESNERNDVLMDQQNKINQGPFNNDLLWQQYAFAYGGKQQTEIQNGHSSYDVKGKAVLTEDYPPYTCSYQSSEIANAHGGFVLCSIWKEIGLLTLNELIHESFIQMYLASILIWATLIGVASIVAQDFDLIHILDEHNELVQIFRTARDKCKEANVPEMKIQLYNVVGTRQYDLPATGTLGAIVFGDPANSQTDYDVIVEYKDKRPKRISKLHSSYMSLQFPILFVYGQPGYNTKMEVRMTTDSIADLKLNDMHRILELKVYRAWVHWDPPNTTEKGYRAILLDKQGHAIQANMEASEINRFKPILIPGKTYRVHGFTCVPTENWQQTLQNTISLSFTTATGFDDIEDQGFPKHYFDFLSYNQLPSRVIDKLDKTRKTQPVLTDYIGYYMSSTDKDKIGNPMKNQAVFRKIEIQNLNRNSLQLTLWGHLAETFNKQGIDALEKPVIIAVSSCRVSRFRNNLELSSTPATYYYIDPDIPELEQYKAEYRSAFNLIPPLPVIRQPFKDKEQEKFRNRFPLADLMPQPMHPYTGVKFTCEGTISGLNMSREWYYKSCNICQIKVELKGDIFNCKVHGPVESPVDRYNFKAYITDGTQTVMMTFFSPKADNIVGTDCQSLVTSLKNPNPKEFPQKIREIVGKRHVFQFHFNTTMAQGPNDFIFNDILDRDEGPKQLENQPSGSQSQQAHVETIEYVNVPQTNEADDTQCSQIIPAETQQSEGTPTTPPYTYMQTRSRQGKQIAEQGDTPANKPTATKRQLFQETSADMKKSKKD
ncbi:nucleic acid-binding, OB-fold protein [Artemisia annua]|uniref:Nucleic acid-binding, OB-fold protein n=1 Tax=Artemisia annua TaxID=35608 RepID=A0A2U1N892_ARTAN|nr:nucleic acid-binding, OB-fold protein [Artemisia annua]